MLYASFTIDKTSGNKPLTVTFTNTSYTDSEGQYISTVKWYFGDGKSSGNSDTVSHKYSNPGRYVPYLVVQEAGTGTVHYRKSASAIIIVTPYYNPTPDYKYRVNYCCDNGHGLPCVHYHVMGGPPAPNHPALMQCTNGHTGANITRSISELSGQYCPYGLHWWTEGDHSTPPDDIDNVDMYISLSGLVVTCSLTGTVDGSVNWDFGDGTSATGKSINHSYAIEKNYIVTASYSINSILYTQSKSTISDASNSPVSISIKVSKFTITGEIESVGSGTIYSVIWEFSDGTSATGKSITHTFSTAGTYSILISYKDGLQNEHGVVRSVIVGADDLTDIKNGNAFADKPLYLPPECNGDVRITAEITKLSESLNYTKESKTSSWDASINFAGGDAGVDGIPIPAETAIDVYVDAAEFEAHPSDDWIVTADKKIENLKYIPAFYSYGSVVVSIALKETTDENNAFDVKCGMQMQFPSYPDWYEGTLTYTSKVMTNLITSSNSETLIPTTSPGVTHNEEFTIGKFSGMPPIELKDVLNYNIDTSGQTVVERACLSTPQFYFQITNNLASAVTIGNIKITFKFYYDENGLLMNTRSEGAKSKELNYLYTLPAGSEDNRVTGLNYPLFGVIDGFKLAEVIRVFGYYAKWDSVNDVYIPTCLTLEPITSSIGTDHPAVLYKSYIDVMDAPTRGITQNDFERLAYKGNADDNDYCKVLTPQLLASNDNYRTINVRCKQLSDDSTTYTYGASPDSTDTIFEITTIPNTTIDEEILTTDLTTHIDKLRFFNCEYAFATSIDIPREEIDPVFRERLYTTYKEAPILQSVLGEPLYFVNFTINDYGVYFPIEHGKSLEFSDSLSHAPNDGVRSSDIFIYSNTTPNKFGIVSPTKYKYRVRFYYEYAVFQDAFVIDASDLVEE